MLESRSSRLAWYLSLLLTASPQTVNPKPQTLNPKPQTLNHPRPKPWGSNLMDLRRALLEQRGASCFEGAHRDDDTLICLSQCRNSKTSSSPKNLKTKTLPKAPASHRCAKPKQDTPENTETQHHANYRVVGPLEAPPPQDLKSKIPFSMNPPLKAPNPETLSPLN